LSIRAASSCCPSPSCCAAAAFLAPFFSSNTYLWCLQKRYRGLHKQGAAPCGDYNMILAGVPGSHTLKSHYHHMLASMHQALQDGKTLLLSRQQYRSPNYIIECRTPPQAHAPHKDEVALVMECDCLPPSEVGVLHSALGILGPKISTHAHRCLCACLPHQ
jgi:hypothetical protein